MPFDYDVLVDEAGSFDELEYLCEEMGYEKPDPDDYNNYWEDYRA